MVGVMVGLAAALAGEGEAPRVTAAPGHGLTVTTADERFAIGVRARFQLRGTVVVPESDGDPEPIEGATQLSTLRFWVQGHLLSKKTRYLTQFAFAQKDYRDGATSPVFDAYLDLTHSEAVSLRIGQIFVPFDRLRTIREFALQLPDRPGVVGELTLDRDVGVYAYSDHLGGDDSIVAYRLGVFGGKGIHQSAIGPAGALAVARLELRPLGAVDDDSEGDLERREAPRLAIGVAAAYNWNTTRARSTTSTVFRGGTADYRHAAADVVFKWRGIAWVNEVVVRDAVDDTLESTDDNGDPRVEYTRSGWGFVSQPSYMLSDRVELAGRYARIGAFDGTDPAFVADAEARTNEVALGASVYLNGHRFKVQGGVGTFFSDDLSTGPRDVTGTVLVDAMF